jgi:peptidoglycan/xylan/chitin deacetylase (PgdA/CDA1 family)
MELKHRLIDGGLTVMSATRFDRLLRPIARGAGVILTFHRVRPWRHVDFAPNRFLEIPPEFLERVLVLLAKQGFAVVALDDVPHRLRIDRPRGPFAAITFDDGYRDNLQYAWPILRRYNVPWSLSVTTQFADGKGVLWWCELEQAIAQRNCVEVTIEGVRARFNTITLADKLRAFRTLRQLIWNGTPSANATIFKELMGLNALEPNARVRETCLGWTELKELCRDPLVSIGSHSISHPRLSRLDHAAAEQEIAGSKRKIESKLGVSVGNFAYPHGDPMSANQREFELVQAAGYRLALTCGPAHVFTYHANTPFSLPRISVNGLHQKETSLCALLSGVPFLSWRNFSDSRSAAEFHAAQ